MSELSDILLTGIFFNHTDVARKPRGMFYKTVIFQSIMKEIIVIVFFKKDVVSNIYTLIYFYYDHYY